MTREQKTVFVKALAKFLVGKQVSKSIALQRARELATESSILPNWPAEWAELRGTVPTLFGYPTVEEAERQIEKFLS